MGIRVSEDIQHLALYTPGKRLDELADELGIPGVKLASNENPLGPSIKALAALRDVLTGLHRYPDGSATPLREALASRCGVLPEQVILGTGSNEIIELLVRTFLLPGDEAITADLTFSLYRAMVTAAHGEVITVPLQHGRYDLPGMAERISPRTRLVFIANPNSPTGTIITQAELDGFLNALPDHVLVVVDEAYREYVTDPAYPDPLRDVRDGRSLVVLRTFSKIYGLAGLRVGYGITRAELAGYMHRVRQPFNTSSLAQAAALAALTDEEHVARSRRLVEEGKAVFYRAFQELGLHALPSQANFVYVDTDRDGLDVYHALLRAGVIVRHIEGSWLRVTVGLPEENRAFLEALKKVLA